MERAVKALEHLAQDPVIEMEGGPPICPHCQKFNPKVKTEGQGAQGPLYQYAVAFLCMECGNDFYGVPIQWSLHQGVATLRAELQGRSEFGDPSSN